MKLVIKIIGIRLDVFTKIIPKSIIQLRMRNTIWTIEEEKHLFVSDIVIRILS